MTIIEKCIEADLPVMLWGSPGSGKTAYVRALAKKMGATVETLIGSMLDPSDVGGIPIVVDGRVLYAPPGWAERILACLKAGTVAWLFLDELSCAPPAVHAALLRLIHERRLGTMDLSGCKIIAASNPPDTAADGGTLPPAQANRFCHVTWQPQLQTWIQGELTGWDDGLTPAHAQSAARVAAFLHRHPSAFCAPPPDDADATAWPSPRSWSAAIKLLARGRVQPRDLAVCVGAGAASEFAAWDTALDLPSPQDLLSGRALPQRGDMVYAALTALVAYVLSSEGTHQKILGAWTILGTCRPDVAITPAKILLAGAPELGEKSKIAAKLGAAIAGAQ